MSTSSEPTTGEPPPIECDLPLGKPGLVVHNRLLLSGCFGTADFGLSASNPSITALAVESTI